jgi:hypothetical protein
VIQACSAPFWVCGSALRCVALLCALYVAIAPSFVSGCRAFSSVPLCQNIKRRKTRPASRKKNRHGCRLLTSCRRPEKRSQTRRVREAPPSKDAAAGWMTETSPTMSSHWKTHMMSPQASGPRGGEGHPEGPAPSRARRGGRIVRQRRRGRRG